SFKSHPGRLAFRLDMDFIEKEFGSKINDLADALNRTGQAIRPEKSGLQKNWRLKNYEKTLK
ncbi:MAG: hypothetical protein RQ753_01755, partial [Desulfurivibrionaceae bacterium]|nr:hypothetical protein [Desulfurivibrionaceae bacterium]